MKSIPRRGRHSDGRGTACAGSIGRFQKKRGSYARPGADRAFGGVRSWLARGGAGRGCTPGTASKWRVRYARDRMSGLSEVGDRGAEPKYGPEHGRRILAMLDQAPPAGYCNWTALLLARELVDIHEQYIWRFLRAQKIDLSGRKSWCESTDPEFVPKAAEIVGLYMSPPDNAVVLSVDEKPSIQALERAQGYLKLPNGRAMIDQSHDNKRNGPTTLFAALNVGTGEVTFGHYERRRRLEFLDFMNRVVKQYQGKEIHVVLDNLSTHKPKRDLWLARHPNVHFHYTPTHTSWLNQIEIWFSILAGKSLKGGRSAACPNSSTTSMLSSRNTTRRLGHSSGPRASSIRSG